MSEFIKIHCSIPNGVILRLFEKIDGPFGTVSHLPKERIVLNPGMNVVPAAFFDQWMEANSDTDFVKNKFIERR
jgi:hypothetical protein